MRSLSSGAHSRDPLASPRRSDVSPRAGRGDECPSTKAPRRHTSWRVPPTILTAFPSEPAELLPDRFRQWFAARGWSPREHQLALLAKARDDRSALLIAPTGAGKTLAGFLPTLVELSTLSPLARSGPLPPRSGGEGACPGSSPGQAPSPPRGSRRAGGG